MASTARDLHDACHWLGVVCAQCYQMGDADLPALIASGRGDVPVDRLPWRCSACGCRRFGFRMGLTGEGHHRLAMEGMRDAQRRRREAARG